MKNKYGMTRFELVYFKLLFDFQCYMAVALSLSILLVMLSVGHYSVPEVWNIYME